MELRELVDRLEFQTGLVAGALGLVLVIAGVLLLRRGDDRRRVLPVAGFALVGAAVLGADRAGPTTLLSGELVGGVLLLAFGPPVAARLWTNGRSCLVPVLAAVPGAALVAQAASLENHTGWVPPLVFATILLAGALTTSCDAANATAGLGPVLVAVAAIGIYTTVPDTEQIAVVLGAALPLALLGTPFPVANLGPGAFSTVGLLCWAAAVGGRARPGSVVGSIACLGVLLIEPIVRWTLRQRVHPLGRPLAPRTLAVIALQIGLVAAASRIAGLETSGTTAGWVSLGVLAPAAITLAALLLVGRRVGSTP